MYFFVEYGDNEFDYHFQDDQTWKLIGDNDVIFNENILYTGWDAKDSSLIVKKYEAISFKDLSMIELENYDGENWKNISLEIPKTLLNQEDPAELLDLYREFSSITLYSIY